MNSRLLSCAAIYSVLLFCLHAKSIAAEVVKRFSMPGDIVSKDREATVLNAKEILVLVALRERSDVFINLRVFKMNFNARHSDVLIMAAPDGNEFEYLRKQTFKNNNIDGWYGTSKSGGHMTFSFDSDSLTGSFHEYGRTFGFWSLPGNKHYIVIEHINNSNPHPGVDSDIPKGHRDTEWSPSRRNN